MSANRVNQILNIKYPFVQGSMNWLTSAELVAAVSNAGGLGLLGPNAGQSSVTRDPVETADRFRREIRKTRALTDKPFGAQYILGVPGLADPFSEEILKVIQEEELRVLMVLGNGKEYEAGQAKRFKDMGFTILWRDLNPSVRSALEVQQAGVDIYIATGYDEGGALPGEPIGTLSIVPLIADALEIPVLAAGGIADNRMVKAVMDVGAEGVYVGTALLVAEESPVSPVCKQDIIHADMNDLVLFKAIPTAWRCIPHKLAIELAELDHQGASGPQIAKRMSEVGDIRTAMLLGHLDEGIVSVSNAVNYVREIRPVKQIIEDMMRDIAL